ncbi:DNA-processing protein DprA [Bacillus cereus]|nr:DNA-processing protein DprA [Bacillus cereus]MEB9555127.1 DNA-processing protein DprA [Bacillus cereus]
MQGNVRSELFFLKQFGFNDTLLQYIFLSGEDPLQVIFNNENSLHREVTKLFTEKEKKISESLTLYEKFKRDLFENEDFLKKNDKNKIFFKYDDNEITKILPPKIMPLFMYSKGDISLLSENRKRVAIIGTRQPSKKTAKITEQLTKKFIKDDYIIVSGLAEGVDTISHETAVKNHGNTIAILPTNFNKIYPKKNKELAKKILEDGLLLTSIGPKENTYKSSFLERNQYIANLSDIIIVTETNLKSGTMNTIRNASEAKKNILFVDQEDEKINNKIYKYGGEMINEQKE